MIAGLGIVCKRRLPGFMHETILFEPSTGIRCRRVMCGEKDNQEVVCCRVTILIKCRGASANRDRSTISESLGLLFSVALKPPSVGSGGGSGLDTSSGDHWFWADSGPDPEGGGIFGAMDVTKPSEFIRFGAMDVTKPYKRKRFGGRFADAAGRGLLETAPSGRKVVVAARRSRSPRPRRRRCGAGGGCCRPLHGPGNGCGYLRCGCRYLGCGCRYNPGCLGDFGNGWHYLVCSNGYGLNQWFFPEPSSISTYVQPRRSIVRPLRNPQRTFC